jgi:hypothetical protein
MAGSSQQVQESNQLNTDPQTRTRLNNEVQYMGQNSGNFDQTLANAQNNYQTKFGQVGLNNDFQKPDFSTNLDATSQNLVAAGQGRIAAQRGAQNANIANSFGSKNPALAAILQQQGNNQSQLAGNSLNFQAMAGQQQRQAQNYQLGQQAQAMGNQSIIAQQGFNNQSAQQGNQALGQQSQLAGARVGNNQNMLAALGAYANLLGNRTSGSQQS